MRNLMVLVMLVLLVLMLFTRRTNVDLEGSKLGGNRRRDTCHMSRRPYRRAFLHGGVKNATARRARVKVSASCLGQQSPHCHEKCRAIEGRKDAPRARQRR